MANMGNTRGVLVPAALVLILCVPSGAAAQVNAQVWGNLTLNWVKSDRLVYELDFEPKTLVNEPEDTPSWYALDVTPNVEFSPKRWLDLVGEAALGYTRQTDDMNSFEASPRIGLRFHLLSRNRDPGDVVAKVRLREQPPRFRIVVRDLVRVEFRNLFYTGSGAGSSSDVRFRNRLEFLAPLNKPKISDDGARYVLADWEWYIPLGEPRERFANKQRIRSGLGYRHSFAWRIEALYIWTRSRNTIDEEFSTSDNIIDIRVKRVF